MPQGFNIGPLTIRFYAILIIIGAILGAWLASRQAKKHGEDSEIILDMLPWLLIGGIIGARLWHVFTPSASNIAQGVTTRHYLENPIEILKMWRGGLGIPGGVIGGALALIIYCKAKKLNFWQWADFIAPGLLVGQAIGRWGNFINQEVYGGPSNLPWAITIDPQFRIPGFEQIARYHPLFLYESLLTLAGAGLLIWLDNKYRDRLYKGDIFFGYLIWYSTVRFFLEFMRLDPSPVNGINVNQTAMLVVGVLALIVLVLRHTVWSDRLAAKELDDQERKLALQAAALSAEEEAVQDEIEDHAENLDLGLPEDLEEIDEDISETVEDVEILDKVSVKLDDHEDWVSDSLPEKPEDWVEEHVPEVEGEELPAIEDDYIADEPDDEDEEEVE
ncbi:MAG: prolipoprotein diacylglyceryl transferase [Anaerolineaceae bacterium]|nr:prolipoprotein diacylglyceryl transferase [Anaerolineaceae bacterium]MDD4042961.1 prolipoprotein diacylglyceryl transferase [Anaerolineaceae bacterium]MDD4578092.1 prolipoprotein diacylglyceryl transferase [Anaerolineaceae bacterium]